MALSFAIVATHYLSIVQRTTVFIKKKKRMIYNILSGLNTAFVDVCLQRGLLKSSLTKYVQS